VTLVAASESGKRIARAGASPAPPAQPRRRCSRPPSSAEPSAPKPSAAAALASATRASPPTLSARPCTV